MESGIYYNLSFPDKIKSHPIFLLVDMSQYAIFFFSESQQYPCLLQWCRSEKPPTDELLSHQSSTLSRASLNVIHNISYTLPFACYRSIDSNMELPNDTLYLTVHFLKF